MNRDRFRTYQELRRVRLPDGFSFAQFDAFRCIFVHIPKAAGVSVSKSLFGNLGGGHVMIGAYRIIFPKTEFDSYFKFSFVRNPWDRLLSAYLFLKQGGLNADDRRWWSDHDMSRYRTFDEFVSNWLSRENADRSLHFLPQYRYLCAPFTRTLCVDFVGAFEHLERDFAYVRERLGFPSDVKLPHLNATSASTTTPTDFRDHYTAATREICAKTSIVKI